ncbi:hypothetical protein C1646_777304 [Rhizophagus diaphanus]|nr:hypothetical protein C1646_777304 [Rhizophagus diaphanus] [Rhizophagus sp. MUCL 43196]
MVQAYLRKEKDMGKQNSKYSEEFTNFLVILASFSNRALDLFRQNLEGRNTLRYDSSITAITDNTKLKPDLYYSSQFGCIIGSTLNNNETKITDYDQIPQVINKIKSEKAFASSV